MKSKKPKNSIIQIRKVDKDLFLPWVIFTIGSFWIINFLFSEADLIFTVLVSVFLGITAWVVIVSAVDVAK